MIVNSASGRGVSRIVIQNNGVLKGAKTLKALRRHRKIRKKREERFAERALRAKWRELSKRYDSLAESVRDLAYEVLETGDAYTGKRNWEIFYSTRSNIASQE